MTILSHVGKTLPPKSKGSPLGWKIGTIVGLLILIALKKDLDALNATQKNLSFLQGSVSKNSRKNSKKVNFRKKWSFLQFFSILLVLFLFREVRVFLCCIQCIKTLLLSYQNKRSNICLYFYPKGGTFDSIFSCMT